MSGGNNPSLPYIYPREDSSQILQRSLLLIFFLPFLHFFHILHLLFFERKTSIPLDLVVLISAFLDARLTNFPKARNLWFQIENTPQDEYEGFVSWERKVK
jgi:hypothetical protein